jgi:hypothetical protein
MQVLGLVRRGFALLLLLAVPAAAGGRLLLDVRSVPDSQPHVEIEHCTGCAAAHDHRLCVLTYHTPWSPAESMATLDASIPPAAAVPNADTMAYGGGRLSLRPARAPPSPV